MACSRFEYVKRYETHDVLLRNTWAVLRLDGRGFTRLTSALGYTKPNDARGLSAMNAAGTAVMSAVPDLALGYGQSDEYSFLLRRSSDLFGRRREKILTTVVSVFSAAFVRAMGEQALRDEHPTFDGRVVLYPGEREVRDYFAWRQADCHVNNLFNTAFWCLVQRRGMTRAEAEEALQRTTAAVKNDMLFADGINYNEEPVVFRKGSVLVRLPKAAKGKRKGLADNARGAAAQVEGGGKEEEGTAEDVEGVVVEGVQECNISTLRLVDESSSAAASSSSDASNATNCCVCCVRSGGGGRKMFSDVNVVLCHEDIIRDAFWNGHPNILQ